MSRKHRPAALVGSRWRQHVTGGIRTVARGDVTPGYVELRRDGRRDYATPLADFHLDWSEVE